MMVSVKRSFCGMLLLFLPTVLLSQSGFVVLNYNVLEGLQQKQERKLAFTQWVKKIDPAIVSFQELNGFTHRSLDSFSRSYGHPYSVLLRENGYPVGLSSKYPLEQVERVQIDQYVGYIYAKVNRLYHVFVVHLDPFKAPNRLRQINFILEKANALPSDEPVLIMGDFNNISPVDSLAYADSGRIRRAIAMKQEGFELQNMRDGEYDYSVIDAMIAAGYLDSNELGKKGFTSTCPTKGYKHKPTYWGGPSRIDYIWLNPAARKQAVRFSIRKDKVTHNLSDHYPLLLTLKE
ncbi:endonuclease/exonuclease/phosphatase family protein [Flavihumibacter sp. UBA7668]|uniref:endonuclease/exonuclease/phosphatase family protein n=1 Tax=Flavihumibacter sp. UBA7668 TaxID=1946542 RepID=UPI0025BFAA8A|nr:endonuclease/exonuclease/phosphatase family protein [Flavihumibacter sp. UBA7668]